MVTEPLPGAKKGACGRAFSPLSAVAAPAGGGLARAREREVDGDPQGPRMVGSHERPAAALADATRSRAESPERSRPHTHQDAAGPLDAERECLRLEADEPRPCAGPSLDQRLSPPHRVDTPVCE